MNIHRLNVLRIWIVQIFLIFFPFFLESLTIDEILENAQRISNIDNQLYETVRSFSGMSDDEAFAVVKKKFSICRDPLLDQKNLNLLDFSHLKNLNNSDEIHYLIFFIRLLSILRHCNVLDQSEIFKISDRSLDYFEKISIYIQQNKKRNPDLILLNEYLSTIKGQYHLVRGLYYENIGIYNKCYEELSLYKNYTEEIPFSLSIRHFGCSIYIEQIKDNKKRIYDLYDFCVKNSCSDQDKIELLRKHIQIATKIENITGTKITFLSKLTDVEKVLSISFNYIKEIHEIIDLILLNQPQIKTLKENVERDILINVLNSPVYFTQEDKMNFINNSKVLKIVKDFEIMISKGEIGIYDLPRLFTSLAGIYALKKNKKKAFEYSKKSQKAFINLKENQKNPITKEAIERQQFGSILAIIGIFGATDLFDFEDDKFIKFYNNSIKSLGFLNNSFKFQTKKEITEGYIYFLQKKYVSALKKINPVMGNDLAIDAKEVINFVFEELMFENQFKNEEEKKYFTEYLMKYEMLAENFDEIKTINLLSVDDEDRFLKKKLQEIENLKFSIKTLKAKKASFNPKKIMEIENEIFKLKKDILLKYPESNFINNTSQFLYEDLLNSLKKDEVIIKFYISELENKIAALVIGKNSFNTYKIPIGKFELKEKINLYLSNLKLKKDFNFELSNELYNLLIQPLERDLKNVKQITIISDSFLNQLPFQTLITKKTKSYKYFKFLNYRNASWLINTKAISYVPSINSFVTLRKINYPSAFESEFVGFGDPFLKGGSKCNKNVNYSQLFRGGIANATEINKLCPLPNTGKEVKQFDSILSSNKNKIFLGKDFTETNLKQLKKISSRVVLFATHGLLDGDLRNLDQSALVMTPPNKPDTIDDGLLTASEIAEMKIQSNLVVLSACNTGVNTKSGPLKSLTASFFFSGVKSLLISSWEIESTSAVKFTTMLIKSLKKNISSSFAFQKASKSMIKSSWYEMFFGKKYHHPYYWSGFNLISA